MCLTSRAYAPASTAPASTAPASTAPASTAPASTAPASTAPASIRVRMPLAPHARRRCGGSARRRTVTARPAQLTRTAKELEARVLHINVAAAAAAQAAYAQTAAASQAGEVAPQLPPLWAAGGKGSFRGCCCGGKECQRATQAAAFAASKSVGPENAVRDSPRDAGTIYFSTSLRPAE
jgi:hypothetical protein